MTHLTTQKIPLSVNKSYQYVKCWQYLLINISRFFISQFIIKKPTYILIIRFIYLYAYLTETKIDLLLTLVNCPKSTGQKDAFL